MPDLLWVRLGDNADYEAFDDMDSIADLFVEVGIDPDSLVKHSSGVEADPGFHGENYISLYRGSPDAEMDRAIDQQELDYLKARITAVRDQLLAKG